MMNRKELPALLALLVATCHNISGYRVDLYSTETSLRAANYLSNGPQVDKIKARFEQIRSSRSTSRREFTDEQLDLLDEIYKVSEIKEENCHVQHFQHIQELINKRAKFDYSSIPFLKFQFWLQYLACKEKLSVELDQIFNTKLSYKQREDLSLLYDKTTAVRGYAFRLLFDDVGKRQTKTLISVLLDGSAAFMRSRNGHIPEILAKHDKDNQFAKEHMEIVLDFCLGVNEPMQELMQILNEIVVDRQTALTMSPTATRAFFMVKVCQRIIEHEDKIVSLAHQQLVKKHSHLERFLLACGKSKNKSNK